MTSNDSSHDAAKCPLCGQPNECQLCTAAAYKGPCWCATVSIPEALLARVDARLGTGLLQADGTLDRAALGRIVFADRVARAELEAIIHPEVNRRISEWFANLPAGTRVAIADIPLHFDTGAEPEFDVVIVGACSPAEQLRRLMARD